MTTRKFFIRRSISIGLSILFASLAFKLHAAQPSPSQGGHPTMTASSNQISREGLEESWDFAIGVNAAWSIRKDYGARTFRRFEPEILGHLYSQLPFENFSLRHGVRIGISQDQPQMPQAVRIEETDTKIAIEEGIVWSWYIVPSLTFGLGYDWRTLKVKTKSPVLASDSRLNSTDAFMWNYTQLGVGIPTLRGKYMIEPVLRWQHLAHDARTNWAFGLEITTAW